MVMKSIFRRTLSVYFLMCCLSFISVVASAQTVNPAYQTITFFADRVLSNQTSDGAIVMGDPTVKPYEVSPYFSNLAAYGLMRAYEVTNNPVYLTAAQQWTEWYIMHLNANGTIYNYTGTPGNWISTNSYDSTDAYASTFLEVAQKVLLYSSAKSSVAQLITAS